VPGPNGSDSIKLEFPSHARHLRLARLVGAGVAADAGFGLDAVEELRVAVDEACAVLLDSAPASSLLTIRFHIGDDTVIVEGRAPCENGDGIDVHPIAAELLEMTTDEFEFTEPDGSTRSFRLVKRDRHDPTS
jgi:serine/threonine-protein kinase RsbW